MPCRDNLLVDLAGGVTYGEFAAAGAYRPYFEEFVSGQTAVSPSRTITEADVVAFAALSGDWNALHTDAEYAADGPFGQRVAHGLLGLVVANALAVRLGFTDGTILGFRGIEEWKFSLPIFIGDTIHARIIIGNTKPLPRLGGGVVTMFVEVVNQHGQVVQQGRWAALFKGKG